MVNMAAEWLRVGLERPTTHFGHGTVCKSGVRSRPFQSFFHGDFSLYCVLYLFRLYEIGRVTSVKKQEQAKVEVVILTFFTVSPKLHTRRRQLDEAIPSQNAR